ncbi:hypothetical protein QYE76_053092 [Lolium multiflorum]|uniref:Uncharacterized protein n=1 Tax=Lolium multiflorum TaxID=4521 RepID=A0AAD8SUZ3_LOLMU|nr:hypothetical protein QYE76_053092 [Lolium multiflorum]
MAEQEAENGSLPGELPPPPSTVNSTTATLDDLKKLESSIVNQMKAMMMELVAPKPTPTIDPNASDEVPPVTSFPLIDFVTQSTKTQQEEKLGESGTSTKGKDEPPVAGQLGGNHAVPPPSDYTLNVPIPMPHILSHGSPPLLESNSFENWQFFMRSHVRSASTELWRIIEEGYSPRDPKHLTRREVVDDQLNATAINMIHMAVTPKDRAHIRSLKTAKEAWDKLDKLFLGNESIKSSRFDEVDNMADNFVMVEVESPEVMYRCLIAPAVQMQDLGATFVDDHWIKIKFYNALLPYEEVKFTAIRQNASFRAMTSDEVLSEVIALDISKKNAEDLVARAHNTRKPNLALKMREHEESERDEDPMEWSLDNLKTKEDNGERLVRKDKFKSLSKGFSKFSSKLGDAKVSFTKKPRAFIIREEYSSDEGEEREDKSSNKEEEGVAAIAIFAPSVSLFDSPNENRVTNNSHFLCQSLTIKREIVGLDAFLTNMQGNTKIHFEALMAQLGAAQDLIEEKERLEREAANEIASLTQAHEEEQDLRMSLEASGIVLEDSNNALISQLTKDRDHVVGLVGELNKKKLLLEDDHKSLLQEVATLTKDFKSLESKYVLLSETCDHPQEEAPKEIVGEGRNSCCDELVDQVASLKKHNALLLEVNALQEEALDEYYRLCKEKTSCCNHEEEIATLEKTKAKLLSLSGMQEESLMECLHMSKEKVTCCDHEEEIAALKRREAKLMEVNSMQEEALKEYFPLSKDRACCNHEVDVAKLESHKRLLMKMNSLQEEALKEHFWVNKEKEVQVFDITHPHPEHEDEVNRLKAKIDRLQIQAQYLEGVIDAKEGANEGSCKEGGVAIKPKRKRRRRTKKKKNNTDMSTIRKGGESNPGKEYPTPTTRATPA